MKGFGRNIEKLFLAVTFAEAGEFQTAREYMREEDRPRQVDRAVSTVRPRVGLRAPGFNTK